MGGGGGGGEREIKSIKRGNKYNRSVFFFNFYFFPIIFTPTKKLKLTHPDSY